MYPKSSGPPAPNGSSSPAAAGIPDVKAVASNSSGASPVFVTVSASVSSLCALITRLNEAGSTVASGRSVTTMAISAEISNPSLSITVTVAV